MYRKLLWITALTFFLLNQNAFADIKECGKGLKEMVSTLKLDKAQKEKIKPIFDQLTLNLKDSWMQMNDIDTQIEQQTNSITMDHSAVDVLVNKKSMLIGSMMKAKILAKNQIFVVLNEPQKVKLQLMLKMKEAKITNRYTNCHHQE